MSRIRPVLVVDHDAEICDHVTIALRDQGYLVHRAEQGAQAIETIDKSSQGISIALRDEQKVGRAILNLVPAALDALQLFNDVSMG